MGDFYKSVLENIAVMQEETNQHLISKTQEVFTSVVDKTPSVMLGSPYATGELVNQWYTSQTSPSTEVDTTTSPSGSSSRLRIYNIGDWSSFLKKDGSVFLTNNVPYVINAEETGWLQSENPRWRNAAPYAMVENAVIEAKAKSL